MLNTRLNAQVPAVHLNAPTIRILLNAVVSEDVMFITAGIKNFYVGTPLDRPEYMRISLKHIPLDIQARYHIAQLIHNDHVLMEETNYRKTD